MLIGLSTCCFYPKPIIDSLKLIKDLGFTVAEVCCLHTDEVPQVEHLFRYHRKLIESFDYLSLHLPTKGKSYHIELHREAMRRGLKCSVVHPDTIKRWDWMAEEKNIAVENMDNRKLYGQNAESLDLIFELLPQVGFVLDIGHASQGRNLSRGLFLAERYPDRLKHFHLSHVDLAGKHHTLTHPDWDKFSSEMAIRRVPDHPVILEVPIQKVEDVCLEIERLH